MARAPMKKPMAKKPVARVTTKKTVSRPTAKKTVTRPVAKKPTVKPVVRKSSSDDAKDIARAKTAVNKKRAAGASNAVRVANAQKYGVKQRMQKKEGLGTSMNRSGNLVGYGINYTKFKRLEDLAGDTVYEYYGMPDNEWKKDASKWLTEQAIKMGVAKNKKNAAVAARFIVDDMARWHTYLNDADLRIEENSMKKKSGK